METMRGSEKQVKWASEIRRTVISIFEESIEEIRKQEKDPILMEKNISGIKARIDALENAEYAGDIISLFRQIKKTDNLEKDFRKLISVYRVSVPCTDGEREILCK